MDVLVLLAVVFLGIPNRHITVRSSGRGVAENKRVVRYSGRGIAKGQVFLTTTPLANPETLDSTLVVLVRQDIRRRGSTGVIQTTDDPHGSIVRLIVPSYRILGRYGFGTGSINTEIITLTFINGGKRRICSSRNSYRIINDILTCNSGGSLLSALRVHTHGRTYENEITKNKQPFEHGR